MAPLQPTSSAENVETPEPLVIYLGGTPIPVTQFCQHGGGLAVVRGRTVYVPKEDLTPEEAERYGTQLRDIPEGAKLPRYETLPQLVLNDVKTWEGDVASYGPAELHLYNHETRMCTLHAPRMGSGRPVKLSLTEVRAMVKKQYGRELQFQATDMGTQRILENDISLAERLQALGGLAQGKLSELLRQSGTQVRRIQAGTTGMLRRIGLLKSEDAVRKDVPGVRRIEIAEADGE